MKKIIEKNGNRAELICNDTIRVYFGESGCAYEEYTFKDWENYGKHRAYIGINGKSAGYIDMIDGGVSGNKLNSEISKLAIELYLAQ